MKATVVTRLSLPSEPRLILFFAGWGMDATPFATLGREGYDTAVVWDYADPAPLPRVLTDRYMEICVVGWSFGVPYAARFIAGEGRRLPVTRCVAVNGTLRPVDDTLGIPRAIFEGTLAGLDERSLAKFYRRMAGSGAAYARFASSLPRRDIEGLAAELRRVETDGPAPDPGFDRVYISGADRIIPPANQRHAWERLGADIVSLGPDAPHMPSFESILRREIADKRVIGDAFAVSASTYESEASIQREMARRLADLWLEAGAPAGPVVELGAGTGMLTRMIAPGSTVRSYDIAPVAPGVERADGEVEIDRIVAEVAPAGVISASTIQWFNSPERFLRRALSALAPGSLLGVATFGPDTYRELAPFQLARPAYTSGARLAAIASRLVDEGIARPGFTAEDGCRRVLTFPSTRALMDHIRRSGVNAPRVAGPGAARALLAAAPVTLTYHPAYLIVRRR